MSTVEALARKGTKAAVAPLGVFRRRRQGDVVILSYHRVGDGPGEIELPQGILERQFQYLSERERVLSLDESFSGGDGGGVVLTFDDGTRDFHEHVVPALVRYGLPATLYLATGMVSDGGDGGLAWPELQAAVSTGLVTIGSHTHSHADLSRVDERTAEYEMRRSRDLIEERLGVPCRHFAYPWAVAGAAADRVARRLFATAALDAWRTNRRGQIDPHRLGRTPVLASDGFTFFRAKVRGLLDAEALLYRALRRGPWRRA
jgi:peptidoglycan/xylan/chitin deacetylase (PgdA/CDA1 family)